MLDDLRLELRARNNVLWHAIFDVYASVSEFSRVHGINQSLVGNLLNLTSSPYKRGGTPTYTAQRLCTVTGIAFEELFPAALYTGVIPSKSVAEVPSHRVVGLAAARRVALPPAQEEAVFQGDRASLINAALSSLRPKQAMVIRERFGLGADGSEHTLREVGDMLGVGVERVRQIEAQALRRLRHQGSYEVLKPLL